MGFFAAGRAKDRFLESFILKLALAVFAFGFD
jgi:hypothetical protein